MQRKCANSAPAARIPTIDDMRRVWRGDRCVQDRSAGTYLSWIRRFRAYCQLHELEERSELTLGGARRFIAWYAARRHLDPRRLSGARTAVYALSRVYAVMGQKPPAWNAGQRARPAATALLQAFADHLLRHRGNPEVTVRKRLDHAGKLLGHLAQHGKTWETMALPDLDAFLIECASRYARTTTAAIACSVRAFARFLLATGRIALALADAASARGLRDHALLLMMSTYGLGAGEIIGLRLEDIDWGAGTLQVTRPKTGVAFTLPLLPAVARVLARYLRHGRPPHTPTRHVFVQMKMPFGPLAGSSAVRHILVKHARTAGVDAPYLGSHVLRHSNAARQIEEGARPRVLSDLLGHRDPESVSAYVRIATESLRQISLPVPT